MTRQPRTIGVLALGVLLATGLVTAVASGGASATATATAPIVRQVSPDNGPLSGGTLVTISGGHFDGATAVDFGSTPAPTGWFVQSPGTIEAIAPPSAGTGTVVVTVTTPAGTSSSVATTTDVYNYVTGPTIQNVSPAGGPIQGGTIVTIAGQGFSGVTGVTFNGVSASYTVDSSTEITATSPSTAGAAIVSVVVTTSGGTTPVDPAARFIYENNPPTVTSLSPASGVAGAQITIKGSHFLTVPAGAMTVNFGSTPGTNVIVKGGKIKVTVPAGSGTVDVTVSGPNGTSAITEPADQFTYTG